MIALLLAGCFTSTVRFPPDLFDEFVLIDTGWDTGAPTPAPTPQPAGLAVDTAQVQCNPTGTVWVGEILTTSWADAAEIRIGIPTDLGEIHAPFLIDSDPAGAWDRYQLGPLVPGADPADFEPGVNTTFRCEDADLLSYAAIVYDRFGARADCVTFGAEPTEYAAALGGACAPL